jgi:hypothetical protein
MERGRRFEQLARHVKKESPEQPDEDCQDGVPRGHVEREAHCSCFRWVDGLGMSAAHRSEGGRQAREKKKKETLSVFYRQPHSSSGNPPPPHFSKYHLQERWKGSGGEATRTGAHQNCSDFSVQQPPSSAAPFFLPVWSLRAELIRTCLLCGASERFFSFSDRRKPAETRGCLNALALWREAIQCGDASWW